MSVLFATVIIPLLFYRAPSPRVGMKKTVVTMFGFNVIYMMVVIKYWPRLNAIE